MKWIFLVLILFSSGCSMWPQTVTPQYFQNSAKDVKEDIDDVMSARTL